MTNLQRYDNDGIELIINTETGESFASISGYARMSGKDRRTITERLGEFPVIKAEIPTAGGVQGVRLITEDLITTWLPKDNPEIAQKMLKAGVRVFLHQLAGFKVSSTAVQSDLSAQLALFAKQISEQLRSELAPLKEQLAELTLLSQAVSQSGGLQKQVNAQLHNDFSEYSNLTFNDVVKLFRPYFSTNSKILNRARHSVGKVFSTEQERELGKISGKLVFSGWEIQTALNCLDRAATEVSIEDKGSILPLMDLLDSIENGESREFPF